MPRPVRDPTLPKWCCVCKQHKDPSEFHKNARAPDGLQTRCKGCSLEVNRKRYLTADKAENARRSREWRAKNKDRFRDHGLKNRYGLDLGDYDRMLAEQNGRCAICRTDDTGRHFRFHVDHCHNTGYVRGLLCHSCNVSLGHFKHDPVLLLAAADYVLKKKPPE